MKVPAVARATSSNTIRNSQRMPVFIGTDRRARMIGPKTGNNAAPSAAPSPVRRSAVRHSP
ncbi:hypothetical protein RHECNPAF_3500010 [Rhizobium etli CNPAF512]|nr:hypothetical protein RHECNPAF_3500010 [Rhizobium etli CNPAF512]